MKLWKKLALAGAAACLIITAGCGKEEGIKASLKDGVLKVELPKSGKPEIEPSHKIQID